MQQTTREAIENESRISQVGVGSGRSSSDRVEIYLDRD